MAELYSQYTSGTQFTAGAIVGSALGTSGLNPIVDRINDLVPKRMNTSVSSGTAFQVAGSLVFENVKRGDLIVLNGTIPNTLGGSISFIFSGTFFDVAAFTFGATKFGPFTNLYSLIHQTDDVGSNYIFSQSLIGIGSPQFTNGVYGSLTEPSGTNAEGTVIIYPRLLVAENTPSDIFGTKQ